MSTWTVIPGGGGDFTTINGAVNAAGTLAGDTVEVYTGTYNETVSRLLANLTIRAAAGQTPVFDSNNTKSNAILTYTGWVIQGFEFRDYTGGVIRGNGANRVYTVQDCYIHDCSGVVEISFLSAGSVVQRCKFRDITGTAVSNTNAITVTNLECVRCGDVSIGTLNATIRHCTVVDQDGGSYGIYGASVKYCTVQGGTAGYAIRGSAGYNNVYGVTGTAPYYSGAQAGDIILDSQFRDAGADDYRPLGASPLVDAAAGSAETLDVGSNPRVGTPDIGAWERLPDPPKVQSASWQSRTSVLVTFDQAMDPGHNLTTAGSWDVLALFGGDAVTVQDVDIVSPESVLLTVSPQGWDTLYAAICPVGVENVFGDPIGLGDREGHYVTPVYAEPESPDEWAVTAAGDPVELANGTPFELVPWDASIPTVSLRDAVWISIFSDRRADEDEPVPDEAGDPQYRGGWWADTYSGEEFGSRLWLLNRSNVTQETVNRARDYAAEAIQWLVDDGLAARVDVAAERFGDNGIALSVVVSKADGATEAIRFPDLWAAVG